MPTTDESPRARPLRRAMTLAALALPLLSLWPGCATSGDDSEDADAAAPADDAGDAAPDVTSTDARFDVAFDTSIESSVDAARDASIDAAPDASADAPDDTTEAPDAVEDVAADGNAQVEAGVDAADDAPEDAPADVELDAPIDAPVDAPFDAPADAPADAPPDGGMCALGHVVISEVRSRGAGGASDEFIELFNATDVAVTLDSTWSIKGRSTTSSSYTSRWTGTGLVVPAWGHFLIAGTAYTESPAADAALSTGITDASSLELVQAGTTVDAVCYYFDSTTLAAFDATYTCEGTPVSNLPHDNTTGGTSNSDASIERAPGGAGGNCTDTNDNAADFIHQAPATPQSTASAPTP